MGILITNNKNDKNTGIYFGSEQNDFLKITMLVLFDDDQNELDLKSGKELLFESKDELVLFKTRIERWIEAQLLIRDINPLYNYFPEIILEKEVSMSQIFSKTDGSIYKMNLLHELVKTAIASNLYILFEHKKI